MKRGLQLTPFDRELNSPSRVLPLIHRQWMQPSVKGVFPGTNASTVQSLVQNRLVLKLVRDLLTIVETALLKVYLIDHNNTLANALLRNQDNCCLPTEVEKELMKHHRRQELVSFYEKQNRHSEALEVIKNTDSLSTRQNILNYLSKLDNNQLPLIFKYIKPMIKSALEETKNENILHDNARCKSLWKNVKQC
ncbi:unnamed protein product [Rotaria sp. Silwood1]|nr:unnamed protein product [Rotaria sp. Silwood1]